jgi:hypothetical protein
VEKAQFVVVLAPEFDENGVGLTGGTPRPGSRGRLADNPTRVAAGFSRLLRDYH